MSLSGSATTTPADLLYARSCHDHLAGQLGVHIFDFLLDSGHVESDDDHLTLALSGRTVLNSLGVDVDAAIRVTRPTARTCLDWTERRHHLATAAALLDSLLARRWLARGTRPRSLRVTLTGQRVWTPCSPVDGRVSCGLDRSRDGVSGRAGPHMPAQAFAAAQGATRLSARGVRAW